jgi:hypothetical protein
MAAGLGFKTFTTGEVLTAGDVNGYLMQGVLVFASATARDASITSPQEGQFAYLKDTNVTTYYTGSAWANLDTTGMTNPMTTTGDMVYSSSGSTPARLGIGSTGNVLTVSGGVPVWSAPAGGGKVLQVVQATYSTATSITSTTYTDTGLTATITPSSASSKVLVLVTQPSWFTPLYGTPSAIGGKGKILRDSTDIYTNAIAGLFGYGTANGNMQLGHMWSVNYLDNPATTSATTYKTQMAGVDATDLVQPQRSSSTSTIILLEIGA